MGFNVCLVNIISNVKGALVDTLSIQRPMGLNEVAQEPKK